MISNVMKTDLQSVEEIYKVSSDLLDRKSKIWNGVFLFFQKKNINNKSNHVEGNNNGWIKRLAYESM
jgi:hypothetical protein